MVEEYLYPKTTMVLLENALLSEVRGRIPELDEIVEDFQAALSKKLTSKEQLPFECILTAKDFKSVQKPFWQEINVEVIVKPGLVMKVAGDFDSANTELVDGKINRVNIVLEGLWQEGKGVDLVLDWFGASFAHEITHAYEQYRRLTTGVWNLDDPKFSASYEAGKIQKRDIHPVQLMKSIIYFTRKIEQRAFVAELYQAGKALIKRKSFQSEDELLDALLSTKTQAGRSYRNAEHNISTWQDPRYWRSLDEAEALAGYDVFSGKQSYEEKLIEVWEKIFNRKAKNISQVKAGITSLWNNYKVHFEAKVKRIAHDLFEKQQTN